MFPVVFAPNSQEFNSHGQGVLIDCLSCEVTEERNGIYELTLTYPSSGHHADALVNDAVIKATSHRGDEGQLFRIYEVTTNFDGHIEVQARHISYQLGFIPCAPFSASSVIEAFTKLPNYMLETQGFTFYTANTTQGSFAITKPRSTRGVLGGEEGSILDVYHGEYEFDNFTVKLHGARGADRGVTLRYGKNITDINQEQAIDETYTGVWPYWGSQDDVYVELPEHVVYCSNYQDFPYKRVMILDCSNDIKDEYGDSTVPTVEQLRTYAQQYMVDHNFGVPKVSIKVSFESEGITGMDQVMLCDTVSVVFPSLHVSTKSKVVKTVYNTLLGRYNSIEIGEIQSNFASTLAKGMSDSRDITSSEIADTRNFLEKKQAEATATLLGANGGYKVERLNSDGEIIETLYMDTLDEGTATKIWRWNINGLGYSPNGPEGPYTVAITKDGEIVADFITTGTLSANIINGGTISASTINLGNGNFVVDGSTGVVTIKTGSIDINNGAFKVTSAGALTSTSGLIGNWSIDNTKLYKTASTTAYTFDVLDTARMGAVILGQLDEATVLAQYPQYDLDGDGHITKFDVELAKDAILGIIPNGVISSANTQLYPSKVYGSVSSIYNMSDGIGFVAGPFGVWGTGLLGMALSLTDSVGSTSGNTTYLHPETGLNMAFTSSYTDPKTGNQWYTHFRGISLYRSGIILYLNDGNNTAINISPTVVSTW